MSAASARMLLSCLLCCLTPIRTGEAAPSPLTHWYPTQGAWWNPEEHGIYYWVNVGPGGFMSFVLTLYDEDGEPTFLKMQGAYEPASPLEWCSGLIGRLRSPLYRMHGGQCLGCDYRDSETVASEFGEAEVIFRYAGTAVFRWREREVQIEPYPLYTDHAHQPEAALAGRWLLSHRAWVDDFRFSEVELVPVEALPDGHPPAFTTPAYRIRCLDCDPRYEQGLGESWITTFRGHRQVMQILRRADADSPWTTSYRMKVEGDLIYGRSTNIAHFPARCNTMGFDVRELRLMRLEGGPRNRDSTGTGVLR
jgi:hypothetical protein